MTLWTSKYAIAKQNLPRDRFPLRPHAESVLIETGSSEMEVRITAMCEGVNLLDKEEQDGLRKGRDNRRNRP